MVDILCRQVGVSVQNFVVMILQEEIVSAKRHHPQFLMQKSARAWGQVKKQRVATWDLVIVSFHNTEISITEGSKFTSKDRENSLIGVDFG